MEAHSGYEIEFYCTAKGESPVDDFLDEMNEAHRAKAMKWMHQLEIEGPNFPRPYADIIDGKIRELRVSIAHHQYRFLYFFHGKRIIMTQGFLKKTSSAPEREVELANRRMADWLIRLQK